MNFKLTKVKGIASVVVPLILWVIVFLVANVRGSVPGFLRGFLVIHDVGNIFAFGNISLFVIEVVIVYVVWSLIQKKGIVTPE